MKNVKYITLAAARAENPAKFDAVIKKALHEAASDVGASVLIKAFSYQQTEQIKLRRVA